VRTAGGSTRTHVMPAIVLPRPFETPTWAVLPFVVYLLLIAALPLFLGRLWEHNRNKLILAGIAATPVVAYLLGHPGGGTLLIESVRDYLSFMALLVALFVISGGIYLRGSLVGTPAVNTAILATGALLASLVGTTGASALLIRPLLRANKGRPRATHVVVFFIFLVANAGGLLTPLGDPPLFLGFLRGVPFTWTLRLAPQWALVVAALLGLFYLFDRLAARAEGAAPPDDGTPTDRLRLEGKVNLLWLLGVVLVVFAMGSLGPTLLTSAHVRSAVQLLLMAGLAAISLATTPRSVHEANQFSWAPILEVGVVFAGVFVTMVPALSFLEERGATLGITQPWQFFWASGALSSVLDNAPTYLTFASLANGVVDGGQGLLSASHLGALAGHPWGGQLLTAVSCGSVMMGANTYIGNGPNFMVKAIAEQHHVRMPSFFGYTLWSGAILLPLFALVGWIFF
jgi:Na+/H+ antiporter NhaD/arsenite permease-like protein